MKNVLLSEIGNNIYIIIEGSRRTDAAARAAISALCARGIISPDLAERAKGDRATLDKIKRNMESVLLETIGDKWNFYTKSGLYMSIPAGCEGYILAESTEPKRKPAAVPRKATKLYITFLCDTTAAKAGQKATVFKNENKWFYEDENGHTWNILPAMLHNHDVIQIDGAEEAPTGEETPEPVQTTTATGNEPENGTQAAKTTDMETFSQAYHDAYTALYDHCGEPESDSHERYYCSLFDANMDDLQDILAAFAAFRGDLLTSDRACAAFMIALETVGTPTAPQNAPQGVESTTGDQTPTYGHKTPYGATDEATTGEATTDGKKITTDGTTDETTPASDPRQPDGNTITGGSTPNGNEITSGSRDGNTITGNTDGGNRITYGATTTPPRTACENAPQRTKTGEAVPTTTQRHKTPSRGKYKASHDRPPKFGKVYARIRVPSGALFSAGAG